MVQRVLKVATDFINQNGFVKKRVEQKQVMAKEGSKSLISDRNVMIHFSLLAVAILGICIRDKQPPSLSETSFFKVFTHFRASYLNLQLWTTHIGNAQSQR